jgi:hypothetical protein
VETQVTTDSQSAGSIRELDDPEFFRRWSLLRQRVALSGKTVPQDLKCAYIAVSAEYRRRVDGCQTGDRAVREDLL